MSNKKSTKALTGSIRKGIFSLRTYNLLQRNGIFTWEDLTDNTEEKLLLLRYSGPETIKEIKAILTKEGLSLKQ